MTAGSAKWYVAHTHAHAEAKAALNLRRQGSRFSFRATASAGGMRGG